VEDWEQHFTEKSLRRAEAQLLERRRQRRTWIVIGAMLAAAITGGLIALSILS
jgi:hypothetical protein